MSILEDAARSHAEPVHLKDKAQIVEYARDNHISMAELARRLEPILGTKARSIERQFNPDRINSVPRAGSRNAEAFVALGKQLPPDHYTPKGDVSGTITVRQAGGASGTREREFSYSFTGSDAYDFVNNPTLDAILGKAGGNNYPQDVINRLTGKGGYGGRGTDPVLIVEDAT